jgi:hypothetical protein
MMASHLPPAVSLDSTPIVKSPRHPPAVAAGDFQILYTSEDEVNKWHLDTLAEPYELRVAHADSRDETGGAPVLLFDTDSLWPERADRVRGLTGLTVLATTGAVVAAHGYRLTNDELDRLRSSGVLAVRRLDERLVARLDRTLRGG